MRSSRHRVHGGGGAIIGVAAAVTAIALGSIACGFTGAGAGPAEAEKSANDTSGHDGGNGADGDGATSGLTGPTDAMTDPDAVDLPKPLTLTWASAPPTVDLEAEGKLAWIHFGTIGDDENSFNQKAIAQGVLPRFTVTGSSDVRTYEDNFTLFSWTNGAARATHSGTRNGVYSKTGFPKFHMDRTVGTEAQRWIVYAGVYKCKALLTVTLGSGPTDPKATAVLDSADKGYGRYVIEHRAPGPNTPLKLTWELTQAYDPSNSNVTFAASTLAAIP